MDPLYAAYSLEEVIARNSLWITGLASIVLLILVFISLKFPNVSEAVKKFLFSSIVFVVIGTTLFLGISTFYLNTVSSSKGPVHWHADVEVWACGNELNLKDPKGLSNKLGTSTLHEHNDKRIHLEGVVVKPMDASLGKFFAVIGGQLTTSQLSVPLNDFTQTFQNGQKCPNGQMGQVQVFVYKTDGSTYSQTKLANPASHIISPFSQVPPGDCVIVEFDVPKDKTEKICRSFKVAEEIGKLEGER